MTTSTLVYLEQLSPIPALAAGSLLRFCLVGRFCPVFTQDKFFRDVFQDLFVQNLFK